MQHYVIKFVSDLRQVGGFLQVPRFLSPIFTDLHDITEMLLKVALKTKTLTLTDHYKGQMLSILKSSINMVLPKCWTLR